ncbi:hypothetical protein Leryth_013236 [Lithospermum erythrorhizon]|nr:hypothetical protein Leryth_013236 [Lithospermum erythrorhizon]
MENSSESNEQLGDVSWSFHSSQVEECRPYNCHLASESKRNNKEINDTVYSLALPYPTPHPTLHPHSPTSQPHPQTYKTDFFPRTFGVATLEKTAHDDFRKLASAIYLQVSIISQALIFVTRSRSWSFVERPGVLLVVAFLIAQLVATLIAVYANWSFAAIEGIGWGWAGVIWG